MANVRASVSLQCRVSEIQDKTDPNIRPPEEGKQWNEQWDCRTAIIDKNEWDWRIATAKAILCEGEADTEGTYYGDVIGGLWDATSGTGPSNQDMFGLR